MPLIVAMSMERKQVVQLIRAPLTLRLVMVDFYQVSIFEEQVTPSTFSLLPLEQLSQASIRKWVVFESLTPVQQVSVIGTGSPFDFDMTVDFRHTVPANFGSFGCGKHPVAPFFRSPVLLFYPVSSLCRMSTFGPSF
jgi:hypothetical protein